MTPVECRFEAEVLAAVRQDRWSEDLRRHMLDCDICADLAAVAGAVDAAREEMRPHVVVPDAGKVWWLAKLRARREAAEAAGRPITAVQVIGFAALFVFLGACLGATSAWFQSALARAQSLLPVVAALMAEHSLLFFCIAALLMLVPAAVWLVLARD